MENHGPVIGIDWFGAKYGSALGFVGAPEWFGANARQVPAIAVSLCRQNTSLRLLTRYRHIAKQIFTIAERRDQPAPP